MSLRTGVWTVLLGLLGIGMVAASAPPASGAELRGVMVGCALAGCAVLSLLARAIERENVRLTKRRVLTVAVLLRLAALPLDPVLSDDGYRYIWDGRRTVEAGASPYADRPREVASMDPVLFERLNSPDFYSVYPPVSQAVFAAGVWIGDGDTRASWLAIKGITVLVELAGIAALLVILQPARVLLYAWHPLAVLEIAGQGHTEGLLVGAIGLLVWSLRRRSASAGLWVAAAAGVKLWPLALVPLALRRGGRAGLMALGAGVGVILVPLLASGAGAHVAESLQLYSGTFDWYAPLYLGLKVAFWGGAGTDAGRVAAVILLIGWGGWVLTRLITDDGSQRSGVRATASLVGGYVLVSPVLHPWHLLPLLATAPLLQVRSRTAVHWLVAWSLPTYLHYTGASTTYPAALAVGWGGALLWWLVPAREAILGSVLRSRARAKWRRIAPHVVPVGSEARILDLGCGEGFVGEAAAAATGAAVTLADVVDLNLTRRPPVHLPARRLPFSDHAFDVTMLSFVLHHAVDAESVLTEATRITRGPVVCLESVPRWNWTRPLLQWIDRTVNQVRSHHLMDSQPVRWRSVAEWRDVCQALNLHMAVQGPSGWFHPVAVLVISSRDSAVVVSASSHTASSHRRSQVD